MKDNKGEITIIPKEFNSARDSSAFPIIGIGASAGGLDALEQLLGSVPNNSGMAYVVIQHLDPTQKGMLPELLQRVSKIKVFQAKDGTKVEPNSIYVIPPNKSMSILKGVLYLFEPIEKRGLRLPVDFFLTSLAQDQKEFAIAVILSGMGSDGSIGVGAVKESNGIVIVQDPNTAKFDSMPRNAINLGFVDLVAAPQEIYLKLSNLLKHAPTIKLDTTVVKKSKSELEKIIILLRTHTGNDFSLYKKNTVYRRIERRMSVHKIDDINSYVDFLQENLKEVDILFKELIIGVTKFFRDPLVWDKLKEILISSKIGTQSTIRAWIPGCSTGEEAYSMAIVLKEVIEQINLDGVVTLQLFATDLANDAIEVARKGIYPRNIEADISSKRLSRFFNKIEDGYQINTEIRETIVFAQHNLIMHPPFTNIDIISCRNLLIYLEPELQKKLLELFFYSLNPNGVLLLGNSETLGSQSHLFTSKTSSLKVFTRSNSNLDPQLLDFPSPFSRLKMTSNKVKTPSKSMMNTQTLVEQLLLDEFSPAGALVNENGDILYINGRTGKYLEPAVGKANFNIFAMLRQGFQNDFAIAFRKVVTKKQSAVLSNVKISSNGNTTTINVNFKWIDKPEALFGKILITFTDVVTIVEKKPLLKDHELTTATVRENELKDELQDAHEEVQNILEEMQTSQEELKSTNEELQSTNEELQSTNEELTTSKEEMQSLNEELQTVNAELQSKVDDYSNVSNDMKNLLNSTDIATLFLDKDLNIRRFTFQATKIFKLIKSDIGRPFTDQTSQLIYPELTHDADEVLRTLIFIEKQIPTKDGRWFSTRIMPYRTYDNRIDGLVITFIDTSHLKEVEEKFIATSQMFNLLLNATSDVVIKLSSELKVLEFNLVAEEFFGVNRLNVIDNNFVELFVPKLLRQKNEEKLYQLFKKGETKKIMMRVIGAGNHEIEREWTFNLSFNSQGVPLEVLITTKK